MTPENRAVRLLKLKTDTKSNIKTAVGITVRVAFVIAVIVTVILKYRELVELDVRELIAYTSNAYAAAGAVVGVYALKSVLFVIPASMLYMSAGLAFDFLPGLLVNALGIFVELNITFFVGKFLGGDVVEKKLKSTKYGDKIIKLRDEKTAQIFLVRLLPVFPIDFVSLFFGASGMKYAHYMLVSFFGIMPRVVIITLLGDTIYDYLPRKLMMILIIVAIIAALTFATVKYIMRKTRKG